MKTLLCLSVLLLVSLALGVGHAHAQTPQNPILITTAPYTITQSGYYRLANNINFDPGTNNFAAIIQVNASNVTIDFNGFYIAGPVGNAAQNVTGVNANERSNLTITNGTIAFCKRGIDIGGNTSSTTNNVGQRVENMRVTYCYEIGIRVTSAPGSRVSFNQVSQIGGSTTAGDADGIEGNGQGIGTVQVNDNVITGVTAPGNARGIYGGIAVRNTITDCARGVDGGKYKDNVTLNCATPFTNGTDAGGNN